MESNNDTTTQAESVSNPIQQPSQQEGQALILGKYKTADDLAKGYIESQKQYSSLRKDYDEIKAKIDTYTPPNEYKLPTGVEGTRAEMLKEVAIKSKLTQSQLESIVSIISENDKKAIEMLENKKKELGSNYDTIKHYAEQLHPNNKQLQEAVLNTALLDPTSAEAILSNRQNSLNSSIPPSNPAPVQRTPEDIASELRSVAAKAYAEGEYAYTSRMYELGVELKEAKLKQYARG